MPDETALASVHALIGNEGFERLVAAFYRQIPADNLLGPLYPADDLEGSERRLRNFLIFRFGGPDHYLHERGHPQLRMRHAPFSIDKAARDRWMTLMDRALREDDLPETAATVILPFLEEVATFLINRDARPAIIS
jgi:hemoglobin